MCDQYAIITFKAQDMKVKAQLFLTRRELRVKAEMKALIDKMTKPRKILGLFPVKVPSREEAEEMILDDWTLDPSFRGLYFQKLAEAIVRAKDDDTFTLTIFHYNQIYSWSDK